MSYKKNQASFVLLGLILLSMSMWTCSSKSPLTGESKNNEPNRLISFTIDSSRSYVDDYRPLFQNGDINVVVEIPTGTTQKWEVDKKTGHLKWQMINDTPRIINYIGYPGNYGMIPKTLLSKESGGDGDPLDVLVLGNPINRGKVVRCKLIGILKMSDHGENDDKLIAVQLNSPMKAIQNITNLEEEYKGVSEIIKVWFSNYKGSNLIKVMGYADLEQARNILNLSIEEYKESKL